MCFCVFAQLRSLSCPKNGKEPKLFSDRLAQCNFDGGCCTRERGGERENTQKIMNEHLYVAVDVLF